MNPIFTNDGRKYNVKQFNDYLVSVSRVPDYSTPGDAVAFGAMVDVSTFSIKTFGTSSCTVQQLQESTADLVEWIRQQQEETNESTD